MSTLQHLLADERVNGHAPAFDISEPPRKRPRVNQACETCRERKTRCDGQQPICKACEKRGVGATCSYVRQKRPSMAAQVYSSPLPEVRNYDGPGFAAINHRSFDSPPTRTEEPPKPVVRHIDSNYIDRPSSVTALFRSISDEPAKENMPRQISQWRPTSALRQPVAVPERMARSSNVAPVLPRRRDADSYVQSYFDRIHTLHPLLHRPTFMRAYEKLWTSDDGEQNDFEEILIMATVNMVFALGSRFSHVVADEHKVATSDDFYQRARKAFSYDLLDSASPSMIQYLLLNVIYLYSTHLAPRCHNTLGLAIRAAQTIGLHESMVIEVSQLQTEMRRRIWHTCIKLERTAAITFGRPLAVLRSNLPLPSPIDDEYLQDNGIGSQPPGKESTLVAFNVTRQLSDVSDEILSSDVAVGGGQSTITLRRLLDNALANGRRTDDFDLRLPEQLKESSGSYSPGPDRMLQDLLETRILLARIYATRPVMLYNAEHGLAFGHRKLTELDYDLLIKFSLQTIRDAQNIIAILYRHLKEVFLLDVWFATYATMTSLMILLAALKSPGIEISQLSLDHSWDQAIRVLDQHAEQIAPVGDTVRILQALKQHILKTRTSARSNDTAAPLPGATGSAVDVPAPAAVNGYDLATDLLDLLSRDGLADVSLSQHFLHNMKWLDLPRRSTPPR